MDDSEKMEDLENEVMSQIDWEMWLNSNTPDPEVLNFLDDLGSGPDPPQLEHSSSNPSPFGQIEHFLMTDDDQLLHQNQNEDQELYHNFLSDILVDSPPLHSDVSDDKVSVNNNNNTCSLEEATTERNVDDDPVSRKRLRQLKNRDAAVRSRERKKMYVKDIEMKSKYLEAECRRLGWLLQSVCAENQSLHLQLQLYQSGKAPGVPVSKQESAVLLLESLLLGSLLWFLGVMCLLSFPPVLHPKLDALVLPDAEDGKDWGNLAPRRAAIRYYGIWESRSFVKSKRCRASRIRMKSIFSNQPRLLLLPVLLF